jgi:hypothetical protein
MRLLHREPETDRDGERDVAVDDTTDDRTRDRAGDRTSVFGRRFRRTDEPAAATTTGDDRTAPRRRTILPTRTARDDDTAVERPTERTVVERRRVHREWVHHPFHFGSLLAIAGGAALAVIGIVALLRGDLNQSWDRPVTHVLEIDFTPLTAALQVGAGALLVLLGLTGRRFLAMFGCVALAVAAAVAAIQPDRLATQYALETWWAWAVAGGAAFVALVLLLPSGRRKVVHTEPESA